jgi:hypothetical protein
MLLSKIIKESSLTDKVDLGGDVRAISPPVVIQPSLADEAQLAKTAEILQELLDSFLSVNSLPCKPLKKLNGRRIAEALQSEAAFTTARLKKHIVATYGLGPCVAVGGYDSINKIAFVVHFATEREVIKCGGKILYNILRLAKKKITKPIQIHLRGGAQGTSDGIIKAIENWMRRRKDDLPMEIVSKDVLDSGTCLDGKSLSINAKNGKVSKYNPLRNPKRREMTDVMTHAMLSTFKPNIRIAFRPKLHSKTVIV